MRSTLFRSFASSRLGNTSADDLYYLILCYKYLHGLIETDNKHYLCLQQFSTSISANADGPRDAASRKIDYIALPTEYNYQETSVGR